MALNRKEIVDIIKVADEYATTLAKGDGEKYMPLFITALMNDIHAADPELAQALKKLASEKANG